jgi:hypothetical protein
MGGWSREDQQTSKYYLETSFWLFMDIASFLNLFNYTFSATVLVV